MTQIDNSVFLVKLIQELFEESDWFNERDFEFDFGTRNMVFDSKEGMKRYVVVEYNLNFFSFFVVNNLAGFDLSLYEFKLDNENIEDHIDEYCWQGRNIIRDFVNKGIDVRFSFCGDGIIIYKDCVIEIRLDY